MIKHKCWFGNKKREDNVYYCAFCGIKVPTKNPPWKIVSECLAQRSPGWGDRVAIWLYNIGLSKHRYLRLKSWFYARRVCGCDKRQEQLNRLGYTLGPVSTWPTRVKAWFFRLNTKIFCASCKRKSKASGGKKANK